MNRISREFAERCRTIAEKICSRELAQTIRELDTQHKVRDAYIKGVVPWVEIKENLDLAMTWQLSVLEAKEHKKKKGG